MHSRLSRCCHRVALIAIAVVVFATAVAADTTTVPANVARRFLRLTADPSSCKQGDVWINITSGLFKGCTPAATIVPFTVGGYVPGGTDVTVADGGTGRSTATAYAPVFGGTTGTGAYQSGTAGTTGQPLVSGGAAAVATWASGTGLGLLTGGVLSAVDPAACTNQFVTDISNAGVFTCTTDTLASAQHANQGTTATVLHGNAAGNPAFGAVVDGDVTFTAPALGAPTATTIQTSGNIGVGVAPSGTAGLLILAQRDANAATKVQVSNNTNGTGAFAQLQAASDNAIANVIAYSSGFTPTGFGVTLGGYSIFQNGAAGNGIIVGTTSTQPLILGTNAINTLNISSSQIVTLPVQAVTAGTMTGTYEAANAEITTCRNWTNAQVAALPTTAGDIAWGTLPAKTIVRDAHVIITGVAVGPATVTVAVGRVGAAYIDYIVASDAKAAANTWYGNASAERGTNLNGFDGVSYTATTLINVHFISTVANLSTVTGSTGMVCITTERLP